MSIALFGTVQTGTGSQPETVTSPGALLANDVLFALQFGDRTPSPSLSSGFTSLGTQNSPLGQFSRFSYKVCGGSEPGTYSFTNPSDVGAQGVVLFAYRGADATTPEENFVVSTTTSNTTFTTAGATASLNGSILLTFYIDEANTGNTVSSPPGGTQIKLFTGGSIATFAVYAEAVSAGASGSRSLQWGSNAWGVMGSFIIRPAVAGAAPQRGFKKLLMTGVA